MRKRPSALFVDQVRQTWPIHSATLETIAMGLVARFLADFCVICLVDNHSGDMKMRIAHDQVGWFKSLGDIQLQRILHRALDGNALHPFQVSTFDYKYERIGKPICFLVLPISLGVSQPRGAIILARANRAFSQTDRAFFGRANKVAQPVA